MALVVGGKQRLACCAAALHLIKYNKSVTMLYTS